MVFREPGAVERDPPVVIRYAPFRRPWLPTALGLVISTVMGASMLGDLRQNRVRCEREEEGAGLCVVESNYRVVSRPVRRLWLSEIAEARFEPYEGHRQARLGRIRLVDSSGASLILADGPRDDAEAVYEQLRGFLDDPLEPSLDVTLPLTFSSLFGFVFLVLFGLGVVVFFVGHLTSYEITVDREERLLGLQSLTLGRRGELVRFDVDGVADVVVTTGLVKSQWRKDQMVEAGQVTLVYTDGRRTPLLDQLIPGMTVHTLLAGQLKSLLVRRGA